MIEKDDFKEYAKDILDAYFPKWAGGADSAKVLVGDLISRHEDIIRDLYVRKTDTKKDARRNVRGSDIPELPSGGGTIRSRMPAGSDNRATYRVGTRNVPRGE